MSAKLYESEEIDGASGKMMDSANPETSFFLGPTSESDLVYVFANKLEALYFLKHYFENQLSNAEKITLDGHIQTIRRTRTDANTQTLSDILKDNKSIEIYAEGYWDEFVIASQIFWEEWIKNLDDLFPGNQYWYDYDEMETLDEVMEDEGLKGSQKFFFSEPPDDVYAPEFFDALIKIIPLA